MATRIDSPGLGDWRQFVLRNGWRASAHDLAHVLGQPVDAILQLRAVNACKRLPKAHEFATLFSLWHGRAPADTDWPAPRRLGCRVEYQWQTPEIALLATLVGQLGVADLAQTLTARLRKVTGDDSATRSRIAVQQWINRIGLEARDVVGGITTSDAAREIGSRTVVQQAIDKQQLKARRVGRLWVIPHANWAEWKSKHTFPPQGYVQLSTLREPLAIRSDKLSEFARMGYIPTAVRCNPCGKGPNTQFGTWFVSPQTAKKLLADRHAGRPMPWHGKPMADNLRATFKLWQQRQHPAACAVCAALWGKKGAPKTLEEYAKRYPGLAHGAKRHLTRPWTPGMTIDEVAAHAKRSRAQVIDAMANGALAFSVYNGRKHASRTDATRWTARKCPSGEAATSWISLETASRQYLFTVRELRDLVARRKLKSKTGTEGAMRGIVYVLRHQCGQLREKLGFTEKEAALRLGVTVARLRALLKGVDWRQAKRIPLVTVQAVRKRLESREGYDLEESAAELGTTVEWIEERIADGSVRVARAKWDRRRRYLSAPMVARLRQALLAPVVKQKIPENAITLGEAALEAGVCATTVLRWAEEGEITRERTHRGWRYRRHSVRARARRYWKSVRFHRATPPNWLAAEGAPAR